MTAGVEAPVGTRSSLLRRVATGVPIEMEPAEKPEELIALRTEWRRLVENLALWRFVDGEMIGMQTKQFSKQVRGGVKAAEHNEVSQQYPGSGLHEEPCRRACGDVRWC